MTLRVAQAILASAIGAVAHTNLRTDLFNKSTVDLELLSFASEAANPVLEFLWYWKGTLALFLFVVVSVVLSHCFQQPAGFVPDCDDMNKGSVWEKKSEMLKLVSGRVELQKKMVVRFWPLHMNRPWHVEAPENFVWHAEYPKTVSPNKEWMNDMPFPNGETRADHPFAMIRAYWSFMVTRKWVDVRTCTTIQILLGVIGPISAQILAWMLDEISTGKVRSTQGPLKDVPGSASQILLLWCVILFALHGFGGWLAWWYDMDIPGGGTRREFKLRLQRQFVAMKGEVATAWPPGRCASVVDNDAVAVVNNVFHAIFMLANQITGVCAIVGVTIYNNRTVLSSVVSWAWIFLFLFAGSILDISSRLGHIQDLAKRKREWNCMESAVIAKQVRESREGIPDEDMWDIVEKVTFISVYRGAHSYFFGFGAKVGCQMMNFAALGIVAYAAGSMVIEGEASMSKALVLILCIQMLAGIQSSLVGTVISLLQAYPSLMVVAEVLNIPVD